MKSLFIIPFTTGIFHSIAIKEKKQKQWGTTLSILGTTSLYLAAAAIREEFLLKPEHQKMFPTTLSPPRYITGSIFVASIHTGAYFCLGHLLTKKAYPVFQDE